MTLSANTGAIFSLDADHLGIIDIDRYVNRGKDSCVAHAVSQNGREFMVKFFADDINSRSTPSARQRANDIYCRTASIRNLLYTAPSALLDGCFIIAPWAPGCTLNALLCQDSALSHSEILRNLAGLLDELHAATEGKMGHGDLHSDNIIVNRNEVYLVDFDHYQLPLQPDWANILVASAASCGPGMVQPPEYIHCLQKFSSAQSDIFSFACICFRAITGMDLFASGNVYLNRLQDDETDMIPESNRSYRNLHAFRTALAKKPEERFASASQCFQEIYSELVNAQA